MANLPPQNQGFPQYSSPIVDNAGVATQVWYKFFVSLWVRSGGTQGQSGPYVPSDVIITGGTIDGVAIGSTAPSTGDFTTLHATGTVTASNFSGSSSGVNTGNQTITLTGGVTGSGTGSFAATVVTNANLTGDVTSVGNATTLTTVNSNVGTFTNATVTANAKGLITAIMDNPGLSVTITTAALTGLGTQGSQTFTNGILTSQTPAT